MIDSKAWQKIQNKVKCSDISMHKSLEYLRGGFPISYWLPEYTAQKGICDLIAGITVGLTLIPQSIAYAALAGLGPEYGLYSSLVGGLFYAIFGTVQDLNIAPTAIVSLLTYSYTHEISYGAVPACILLCFWAGILETICGLLHLGFLVDFVSTPVVAGFTSAGALTIAASQLKNLLGLKYKSETFVDEIYQFFAHIEDTKLYDCILSLLCCSFLISLREVKRFGSPPTFDKASKVENQGWKTALWFVSVARNAIVVITCAIIAYILGYYDEKPFSLTGPVPQGLPAFHPAFFPSNKTVTFDVWDCTKELGSGVFVVPFVSILSNIAIAKSFSQGKVLDASQEMIAIGACNFAGSFFGSYPVAASFSRAAVNNASGARTPFGGLYALILVILSLTFLTPYFAFIPKPTLSSVIICAVIYMVEVNLTRLVWKISKIDFIPLLATLIACLAISLELGILIGILIDLILVMYYTARPKIEIENVKHGGEFIYFKVHLVGFLVYSSAEYARDRIMQEFLELGSAVRYIVFDCGKLRKLDFTSAQCINSLLKDLSKHETKVVFLRMKPSLQSLTKNALTSECTFLQSTEDLETFFQDKDKDKDLWINSTAIVNSAYQPDQEIQMKSVTKM